jgi:hypothetical protein
VTTAVPWLRRLAAGLPALSPGFDPGSVHVGFVVDKVAMGQVFPRVLRFSPVNFIPPVLHYFEKDKKYSSSSSSSQGCTRSLKGRIGRVAIFLRSDGMRTLERVGRIGRVGMFLLSNHTASYCRRWADRILFTAGR